MIIFAICFSNYFPIQVHSLWMNKSDAEVHAAELGEDWRVEEMEVYGNVNTNTLPDSVKEALHSGDGTYHP